MLLCWYLLNPNETNQCTENWVHECLLMMLNLKICRPHWHTLNINCNNTVLWLCSTSYLSLRVKCSDECNAEWWQNRRCISNSWWQSGFGRPSLGHVFQWVCALMNGHACFLLLCTYSNKIWTQNWERVIFIDGFRVTTIYWQTFSFMQYIQGSACRFRCCTNKLISVNINVILTHWIVIFFYVCILFINTVNIGTSLS